MATALPLGIVSLKAEGAYSSDKLYKKGMWVTFSGSSYAYINPTPAEGAPVTNTTYWQQIAVKGDKGNTGDTGDSGVYVGTETPVNGETVWIDTDGTPTKMYFKDKVILTTDFVADATYTEFPFKADIPCVGVTSTMYASLAFAYAQATSGDFAPVCDTGAGIVTIYAAEVPAADITIPVIEVLAV